ncbi:juvenile hormone esterase-like [Schistocerca gregaria]|uniref:juvenile hormone esterase-like n=1 Tax=Schistocerca gregaria TaxID=7010 RepID=UPI00211ED423|nr:juvenile hormone esterase-like [Schistocerca gregaria]
MSPPEEEARHAEVSLTVRVEAGAVRGRVAEAEGAAGCHRRYRYRSFQGIPYARPPLGQLRFKPPEAVEPWEGVRDAICEGAECAQLDFWERYYKGDEDCLYLNVYTPLVEPAPSPGGWPVMVWVHGGGFAHSSGTTREYGPDYLLAHQVILVTFNYRLGPLGFLTTGDAACPGNMGLRDVLAALQWVRRNIAAFGGDADNVTIFGESAGSIICHGLLLSPAADGLFHKVICQSGVTFAAALNSPVADRSWRLARHMGLQAGATSHEMLDFLRGQPARALVENQMAARSQQDVDMLEQFPFVPVLEAAGSPGALITREPADLLRSGAFRQRPLIIGFTSREGLLFFKDILQNKSAIPDLDKNFHKIIPSNVPMKDPLRVFVGKKIKKFYFGGQPFDESSISTYCDVRGDMLFLYPSVLAGRLHARLPDAAPLYLYHFAVDGRLNMFKKRFGADAHTGASHGDDVLHLFTADCCRDVQLEPDCLEARTVARMTRMWTNFAKTGNPTPDAGDPVLGGVAWPSSGGGQLRYLDIGGGGLRVLSELPPDYQRRVAFWDGLAASPAVLKIVEFVVCCRAALARLLRRN